MAEQYIPYTVNPIAYRWGNSITPVTMIEVQFTSNKEVGVRHWACGICGRVYPQTEMAQVGGGWYCTRYKHDIDKNRQMNRKPIISIS
jgi:hypothetical protein